MQRVTFRLPAMYADHHVTEVRRLILEIAGVAEVHASSAFQRVEVYFDEGAVAAATIENMLVETGYARDLPLPVESGAPVDGLNGKGEFYRRTAAKEAAVSIIGFGRQVPAAQHGLWPCPGFGALRPDNEEINHG
jgi:copper chaperone CopZ